MAQVGSRGERLDLIVRQESTLGLLSVFICSVSWTFLQEWYARGITYAAFGFYIAVKWAELTIAKTAGSGLSVALLQIWGAEDRSIVILVLSYWFGNRSSKATFGGSAMNSSKGA